MAASLANAVISEPEKPDRIVRICFLKNHSERELPSVTWTKTWISASLSVWC